MDNLRGAFDPGEPGAALAASDSHDASWSEDTARSESASRDLPPHAIGQDERRMQVRAYNHWASLLGDRMFPLIEDLDPVSLADFAPYSVLLDFSAGIDDPAVLYLGNRLAEECEGVGAIRSLADVPARSLLSRITDHYMQILANQAPIGFEAEFINQRGATILYRGILLPYSSDDQTIDFIYGVINWKELADAATADELLLEIDQALELEASEEDEIAAPSLRAAEPLAEWADSPAHETPEESDLPAAREPAAFSSDAFGDDTFEDETFEDEDAQPDFSHYALDDPHDEEDYEEEEESEASNARYNFASLASYAEGRAKKAIDPSDFVYDPSLDVPEDVPVDVAAAETPLAVVAGPAAAPAAASAPGDTHDDAPADAGDGSIYDCLASARELALAASLNEDRSRSALYAAVGRAYDVSLAAQEAPEAYADLIAANGLTVQERAPMTPVVKLVFGADYDKTRLTEYAAVLAHAHRIGLERGALAPFLTASEGGLKGVVTAERRLRREDAGTAAPEAAGIRASLARKLRALEALTLEALAGEGPEFALVMVRRTPDGDIAVIGELAEDVPLLERAARRLVG